MVKTNADEDSKNELATSNDSDQLSYTNEELQAIDENQLDRF